MSCQDTKPTTMLLLHPNLLAIAVASFACTATEFDLHYYFYIGYGQWRFGTANKLIIV